MKKFVMLLSVLLGAVCSMSALTAEEIVGKWESNTIKQEATPEMPMAFSEKYVCDYKADQSVDFKNDASMSIEIGPNMYADIFVKAEALGQYTVAGDSITITCNVETVKITFTEDDVRIRGVEDASQEHEIQQQIYQGFQQSLPGMIEQFGTPQVFNKVMVTGQKMMCTMDDTYVTFKRKKK